jgi:hypothetical protein
MAAGACAGSSPIDLQSLQGTYKVSHTLGKIAPPEVENHYRAEDVLEIVQLSEREAYYRLKLNFYNEHQCNAWGIADVQGRTLVHIPEEPESIPGRCVVRLVVDQDSIEIVPDLTCTAQFCGVRGGFEGTFPRSSKQPVPDRAQMLQSISYQSAMCERRTKKAC